MAKAASAMSTIVALRFLWRVRFIDDFLGVLCDFLYDFPGFIYEIVGIKCIIDFGLFFGPWALWRRRRRRLIKVQRSRIGIISGD